MQFTRQNIIKLFAEQGIEVTDIAVLRWGEFIYEDGVARLVASINPRGYAYSIQTVKSIGKAIKSGKKFKVKQITRYSSDYDFWTE